MKKKEKPCKRLFGESIPVKSILTFSIIILITVFGFYFNNFNGSLSNDSSDWADFGSYIGGIVGPLLSFLSLIALLITIVIQSRELKLSREELELSRNEVKRSADALEKSEAIYKEQSNILQWQKFESTFFSLLEQHNSILTSLSIEQQPNKDSIINSVAKHVLGEENNYDVEDARYRLETHNNEMGSYFRVLYQTLIFISIHIPGSKIKKDSFEDDIKKNPNLVPNEKNYSNIVRAFLSDQQLKLLALNCYCENDNEKAPYYKFKLLIERYSLLEHMEIGEPAFEQTSGASENIIIIYNLAASGKYEKCAFGDRVFYNKVFTQKKPTPLKDAGN